MNGWSALASFVALLPGVPVDVSSDYAADPSRVLFAGHSMGGHGCLVFSTAYTDRATGIACAAGWITMYQVGLS